MGHRVRMELLRVQEFLRITSLFLCLGCSIWEYAKTIKAAPPFEIARAPCSEESFRKKELIAHSGKVV